MTGARSTARGTAPVSASITTVPLPGGGRRRPASALRAGSARYTARAPLAAARRRALTGPAVGGGQPELAQGSGDAGGIERLARPQQGRCCVERRQVLQPLGLGELRVAHV